MTVIEKRKRSTDVPARWPLIAGRLFLGFAFLYTAAALLDFSFLFGIYGVMAGMALTFFWPVVCFSLFMILNWHYYRTHGQPTHAQGVAYFLCGVVVMVIGMVDVVLSGFVA